jgi:transcriptional regulator with XRE-family HTH domain
MNNVARQFGRIVRDIRKQRGMTGVELALKVGISQSIISKIENGHYAKVDPAELERILNILEAPASILQRMQGSASYFSAKAGEQRMRSLMSETTHKDELVAKCIRCYANNVLPAIVQTRRYRKRYMEVGGIDASSLDKVSHLMERQDMLWEGGRRYSIIVPQSVLYSSFVPASAMRAQLDRLERIASLPHVQMGVIPLTAGMPLIDFSSFVMYDDQLMVVALPTGENRNSSEVTTYLKVFESLEALACYGAAAVALIRQAMDYTGEEPEGFT